MKFEDLLRELENGKTFEEVFKEDEGCMVERIENVVYEDDDLYAFLQELGAEIVDRNYGVDYVIIRTENNKKYKVPYKEIPNGFGEDLPNESVLYFKSDMICDITENYEKQKDDFTGRKMTVPEAYKKDFQTLIKNERDAILYEIECIIDTHGEGTQKESDARAYEKLLRNILRNIE